LYYWDTAHDYRDERTGVISEVRLGRVLKDRRKEVFLSTKVGPREPDEAKRHIEESLSRLQTDYLNILQIHSINSVDDAKNVVKKGGLLDLVRQMREQGVAKYIGFTGHSSAEAMAMLASNYDFDTMLVALNHYDESHKQQFEGQALPAAGKRGMGVLVMKVIRPRETVKGITAKDLIRYALSLKYPTACIVGTDGLGVLKENIETLKTFKPMSDEEMKSLRVALAPFYRHEHVAWMHPSYRDGMWT